MKLPPGRRSAILPSLFAILLLVWPLAGCARPDTPQPAAGGVRSARPAIVFMTDFGTANDAVAICKAVMLRIDPDVRIMDITHQVTPFSIAEGARFLAGVTPYYPSGTVFLVVVDPGVGSARKAVVVKSKKGEYFVLPDNGLITPVADRDGIEGAREITNPAWMIGDKVSSTFHGRDIFSPAAAHLAAGQDWTQAGPDVPNLTRLQAPTATVTEKGIEGQVIGLDDPYGSLITDISRADFEKLGYALGDQVSLQLDKKPYTLLYKKTFSEVPVGQPLLYIDSRGRVGLAINQGDFSKARHISPPVSIFIPGKAR